MIGAPFAYLSGVTHLFQGDQRGSCRAGNPIQVLIAQPSVEGRARGPGDSDWLKQIADAVESSSLGRSDRRTEYVFELGYFGSWCVVQRGSMNGESVGS